MKEVTSKEIKYWIFSILIPMFWIPATWFLKDIWGVQVVIAISAVLALLLAPAYSTILAIVLMTFATKSAKNHKLLLPIAEFCAYFSLTLDRIFRIIPGNPFAYGRISHSFVLVTLLQEREDIEASQPVIEESIAALEKDYGIDAPPLIGWLANLAHCQEHEGNLDESLNTVNRLLALADKHGDDVQCSLATNLIGICTVFSKRGRMKEAEEIGLKALNMLQEQDSEFGNIEDGNTNVLIGIAMNNLACVYDDMCKYDESYRLYERALKIKAISNSPDNPSIGAAHSNLAGAMVVRKDFAKALEHAEKALEILEVSGKKNNSIWAGTLENLGAAKHGLKNFDEAKSLLLNALELKKDYFADSDPNVASTYKELGKVYRDSGDVIQAEEVLSKSLKIYEDAMGLEHPKVKETLQEFLVLYEKNDDTDKAKVIQERIEKINSRLLEAEKK